MIKYDTSNDKTAKAIIAWCKENGFAYSFDSKDKLRSLNTYPFNIDASSEARQDLLKAIS